MNIPRADLRALTIFATIFGTAAMTLLIDKLFLRPDTRAFAIDSVYIDSADAIISDAAFLDTAYRRSYGRTKGSRASDRQTYATPSMRVETFDFDPNTADSTTLLRLGLSPWQVKAIYTYRARNGRYHRAEDFKRVPGMTPETYNRLAPHIRIGEAFRLYSDMYHDDDASGEGRAAGGDSHRGDTIHARSDGRDSDAVPSTRELCPPREKFRELITLDLNTVDTTTLKKVPGIASYRARKIVEYRERLGGFASVDQLSDIGDVIPDELKLWFTVETPIIRPLNINSDDSRTLSRHPYISYRQARAIIQYRKTYGRISSLSDLSLLEDFTEADIRRLTPYITF